MGAGAHMYLHTHTETREKIKMDGLINLKNWTHLYDLHNKKVKHCQRLEPLPLLPPYHKVPKVTTILMTFPAEMGLACFCPPVQFQKKNLPDHHPDIYDGLCEITTDLSCQWPDDYIMNQVLWAEPTVRSLRGTWATNWSSSGAFRILVCSCFFLRQDLYITLAVQKLSL